MLVLSQKREVLVKVTASKRKGVAQRVVRGRGIRGSVPYISTYAQWWFDSLAGTTKFEYHYALRLSLCVTPRKEEAIRDSEKKP